MSLTPKERQHLKGRAHSLKPVVMIGNNGITDAVNKEIDRALNDHELIKIRVLSTDREQRREIFAAAAEAAGAQLVQTIGAIGVFYRKRKD
jgi:RNA-binding protein